MKKDEECIEECKNKIQAILKEYNCELLDPDEGMWVLLHDRDTDTTISVYS